MSVTCPHCRSKNDENNQFCSQCGAKLGGELDSTISFNSAVEATEEAQIDIERLRREGPLLIVVKGIGVGQTFSLVAKKVSIGRDPTNDIFLDDVTVSRQHAQIRKKNGDHEIIDTGSLNGTYVNKKRVESSLMVDHDEVQIGKFKMIFIDHGETRSGD